MKSEINFAENLELRRHFETDLVEIRRTKEKRRNMKKLPRKDTLDGER